MATAPRDLVRTWADAEAAADVATLDTLLAPDFTGIGPVGFVLDRDGWLGRFAGGFTPERLDVDDVTVREHDDVAVAVGTWAQEATYAGHRSDGRFRVSAVLRRDGDGGWRLFGAHLSGPMPPEAERTPAPPASSTS